jgi:predicted permease
MLAIHFFRALLWGYPAPFRKEYGGQMTQAFAEQMRLAPGWRAKVPIWFDSIADLFLTAPQEHYHVIKHDLRYAIRALRSQPGFAAVAILSLALGIGANVAIFSLLNSILYRMLPVHDPHELVMLTDPGSSGVSTGSQTNERSLLTYEEFEQLRDQTNVFAGVFASQSAQDRLPVRVGGAEPEEIRSRMVSAAYFETLGVPALRGRALSAADAPQAANAVISYDYWQRRLGGRADALGTTLTIHDGVFTIIGVMPPSFFGETVGDRPEVWLPLSLQPVILPGRDWLHDRPADLQKVMWLHVFGRLKPGATIERAQAAANVVFQQGLSAYYASSPTEEARRRFLNQRLRLRPAGTGASEIRDDFGQPLILMLAAAGLVLLIACANLGNLMLARATARAREVAVKLALGAGRGDLVRQLLTESMLIAFAGGAAGLATALLMRAGLLSLVSETIDLPLSPDADVLAFAFGLTLFAGLILGLLPILRTLGVQQASVNLKEQGRGLTASAAWLRAGKLVVAGQVALSLPLLAGAALLVQSLQNLQRVDLGYARERLLMVRVDVRTAGYEEPRRQALFERLHARVRATPGVHAASYSQSGLLLGSDSSDEVVVEGYTPQGDNDRGSRYDHIGPGFFSTLGIPLLLGREITEQDQAGRPKVCVINEAFAKRFFAGRHPLGLHVTQVYGHQRNTFEVVGVVANSRKRGLRGEIEHRYYVPVAQPIDVPNFVSFAIRTGADPAAAIPAIRKSIRDEDTRIPILVARTMEDLVAERLVQDRLLARLSGAFGVVALLLAAIGLYGVLSYGIARRTSEIGIRKALGAQNGTVITMILRETGWLLGAGLMAGTALSFVTLRWIESRLYGLTPGDPATLTAAFLMLGAVGLMAAWLPARRAARIDPLVAIRYE